MIRSISQLVFFILLTLAFESSAETKFETLKSQFEKKVSAMDSAYDAEILKLKVKYEAHLATLLESATAEGDLDAALAIKAEKEDAGKEKPSDLSEEAPADLVAARRKLDKAKAKLLGEHQLSIIRVKATYIEHLDPLIKETTKAGELEAAVAIRKEAKSHALNAEQQALLKRGWPASAPLEPFPTVETIATLKPISKISSRQLALGSAEEKTGWKELPPELADGVVAIFDTGYHKHVGVAEVEVTKAGNVYVIGNWHYQGSGGSWEQERWRPADFEKNGWRKLKKQLLHHDSGRKKDVFYKHHEVGEKVKLRTNKYTPPFFIGRAAAE